MFSPRQAHNPLFELEGDRSVRGRGFRPHGVRTVLHEVRDFGDTVLVRVEAVRHDHALTVVGEHVAAVDGEGENLRQGPTGGDGNHPSAWRLGSFQSPHFSGRFAAIHGT